MGFLSNLFKSAPKRSVVDDFFGELRIPDQYEADIIFAPTRTETIVYFDVEDENGSTERQRKFYNHIVENYKNYTQAFKPSLENELNKWFRKPEFSIHDFDKEFSIEQISLPSFNVSQKIEWSISYTTIHEPDFYITINMSGDVIESVNIDR